MRNCIASSQPLFELSTHDKYFKVVFDELKKLTQQPAPERNQIGFKRTT
jgi:hypothetical protein